MKTNRIMTLVVASALSAFTITLARTAEAQTASPAASDLRTRLSGTFHYSHDAHDAATLDAVADAAVADMNFVVRAFARGRLREGLEPPPTITFSFPAGSIVIESPRGQLEAPDTGADVVRRGQRGREFHLRHQFTNDGVLQVVNGAEMTSRTEFTISPDGRVLTMHVHATSSHLSRPLTYAIVFRR